MLDYALALAKESFYVFPLIPNGKTPAIKDWPNKATTDLDQIKKWWAEKNYNIGIYTGKYKEGALLVVDVDNKNGKCGDDTIFALDMEGFYLPATRTHHTPTGGRHLIYFVPEVVKGGVEVLGSGLDIRSKGGYIVAPGSTIGDDWYTVDENTEPFVKPTDAPQWIVEKCGVSRLTEVKNIKTVDNTPCDLFITAAYLKTAPVAVQNAGGDQTTYKVACQLKDFGHTESDCYYLLKEFWNAKCSPPWSDEELKQKVHNAYKYGLEPIGINQPNFSKVEPELQELTFVERFNKNYAFVLAGGGHHILWETTDALGKKSVVHLLESSFHKYHAAETLVLDNGKTKPLTELWMRDPKRRTYKGICFLPGLPTPLGWYNLWQGFAVDKSSLKDPEAAKASLAAFLEHAELNVCQGDKTLNHWLIGFFAHMIQKPWQKPLTALVFKGPKGVGKNALVDRIGHLIGNHYLLTAEAEHIIGRFNAHLEKALMLVLDEALWAGDKNSDGRLKNLITGSKHNVEYKGKEIYQVENCTRVIVMGNEDWLVPASQDERRFAVFNVGTGRQKQLKFFKDMRIGMEAGGYYLLLEYLMNYDISDIDVDSAPSTEGLLDQKLASLNTVQEWWFDSLNAGTIVNGDFAGEWPEKVPKDRLREAFNRYAKDRHIKGRNPTANAFGRVLKACVPNIISDIKYKEDTRWTTAYGFPSLQDCRAQWEIIMGHKIHWECSK